MIQVGASFELKTKVTEQNTALAVGQRRCAGICHSHDDGSDGGSGAQCLAQFLEEGKTSGRRQYFQLPCIGYSVGMEVRAVATITEVDGKKVKFAIEAYDEAGLIGKGDHLRIIVTRDRFLQGAADKLQK